MAEDSLLAGAESGSCGVKFRQPGAGLRAGCGCCACHAAACLGFSLGQRRGIDADCLSGDGRRPGWHPVTQLVLGQYADRLLDGVLPAFQVGGQRLERAGDFPAAPLVKLLLRRGELLEFLGCSFAVLTAGI